MHFTVQFRNGFTHLAREGLALVDEARYQLSCQVPASSVSSATRFEAAPTIELDETEARAAGKAFHNTQHVDVFQKDSYSMAAPLAEFVTLIAVAERDGMNDAILRVTWDYEIDIHALIAAWLAAGAPCGWSDKEKWNYKPTSL